jgi:hypothetical protein
MKLRLVYRGDFRKNEMTLFAEAMKANKELQLGPEDCVLLVSASEKMLKFVFRPHQIGYVDRGGKNGTETTILESETFRITGGGRWNPLMLGNYAAQLDIEIEGIKKFESYYKARLL